MTENKREIIQTLLPALQKTRRFCDLDNLYYITTEDCDEKVVALYANGCTRKVNVTGDSGWALIRDIVNGI